MDSAILALIAALGETTSVFLVALFLLRKVEAGPSRTLVITYMAILIAASLFAMASFGVPPDSPFSAIGMIPQLLDIWSMALIFHFIFLMGKWSRISLRGSGYVLVYLPALYMTVSLSLALLLIPSTITTEWRAGIPLVQFGLLTPLFIVAGVLYGAGAIVAILFILRGGVAQMKRLLVLISVFLAVQAFNIPIFFWLVPGPTPYVTSLILSSLVGLILAYSVTRESPLLVPRKEEGPKEERVKRLDAGATYLFASDNQSVAQDAFVHHVRSGLEGLWISRRPPPDVKKTYGLVKTPFIWLTNNDWEGELCIPPAEIGRLSRTIREFIDSAQDYVILFEGMEYLVTNNGFHNCLTLVQHLNDRVMGSKGVLLLSLNPEAFDKKDVALLASETRGLLDVRWEDRARRTASSD